MAYEDEKNEGSECPKRSEGQLPELRAREIDLGAVYKILIRAYIRAEMRRIVEEEGNTASQLDEIETETKLNGDNE